MNARMFRVHLVFEDWRGPNGLPVNAETNIRLSTGDFHSGSTFLADIHFPDLDQEIELEEALDAGYLPVFLVRKGEND